MSPQGLNYLQFKIIHGPKWHILGSPVLDPFKAKGQFWVLFVFK